MKIKNWYADYILIEKYYGKHVKNLPTLSPNNKSSYILLNTWRKGAQIFLKY